MTRHLVTTIACLFLFAFRVQALSAIPGSPCYDTCNGGSAATSSDIVCLDNDFTNSTKGQSLKKCLSCLHDSTYKAGFMTDSILFLYYLSTVQQTCLSGNQSSACSSRCSSLSGAFSNIAGRAFFTSTYSYCSANNSAYTSQAADCATCLQAQAGTVILGNFVSVGDYACSEQPSVSDGQKVDFPGDLFAYTPSSSTSKSSSSSVSASSKPSSASTSATSVGASSTSLTSTSETHASTTTISASNNNNDGGADANSNNHSSGSNIKGLSRGAAAGIGIVVGVVGVAAIIGIAILLRRRQKSNPFERMQDSPGPQGTPKPEMTISNKAAALGATPPEPAAANDTPEATENGDVAEAIRKEVGMAAGVGGLTRAQAGAKSLNSSKSATSAVSSRSALTPMTSQWFHAANPKMSSDLSALPQKGWD